MANRLSTSASPYLRQHMNNPVDWHPWGAEAIALARAEDKPIHLSVGYSSCYWCHVMEREVFENPSIAAQMNATCVNIKLDREEHPDLDEIYMTARQLYSREAGWPNTVFLNHELKPFFVAGTFGPVDAGGRKGFPQILAWVEQSWRHHRHLVNEQAENLAAATQQALVREAPPPSPGKPDEKPDAERLFAVLDNAFDKQAGGFFTAPKFPRENWLLFLLQYYRARGDKRALEIADRSLARMVAGGIHDHVGGGFHRYAVDKDWLVPHFEKMLYNQALMVMCLVEWHEITGSEYARDVARAALEFTCGPALCSPGGVFYAAIDAETDGVEGAYYVWNDDELEAALSPEQLRFLKQAFMLAEVPPIRGHRHPNGGVLNARQPVDVLAAEAGMPYAALAEICGQIFNTLLDRRNERPAPRLDNKVLTGWNGLMIASCAKAGTVFNHQDYIARAHHAAEFLLSKGVHRDGTLARMHAGGMAQLPATLEDYAYFAFGLLALAKAIGEERYTREAARLMREARQLLRDEENGGYFTSRARKDLIMRIRNASDGATPAPNAIMLHNLVSLARETGEEEWFLEAQAQHDTFRELVREGRTLPDYATFITGVMALESLERERMGKDVVRLSAALSKPAANGECEMNITLEIAPGWWIYAHDPQSKKAAATSVEIKGEGIEQFSVQYPSGRLGRIMPAEKTQIYEGRCVLTARLRFAKGRKRDAPVTLTVSYQPCNDKGCGLPQTSALEILPGVL